MEDNIRPKLSHTDERGRAQMVDVGHKPALLRAAAAESFITLQPATLKLIDIGQIGKGEVLAVARIAGIQAGKLTSQLIPLCHPLPLTSVSVELLAEPAGIRIIATAKVTGATGVEMEALTAASVAALTIYDMCKAVDKTMVIGPTQLVSKEKQALPGS
jgi:cyclic pyranopterin monophosphate synthase